MSFHVLVKNILVGSLAVVICILLAAYLYVTVGQSDLGDVKVVVSDSSAAEVPVGDNILSCDAGWLEPVIDQGQEAVFVWESGGDEDGLLDFGCSWLSDIRTIPESGQMPVAMSNGGLVERSVEGLQQCWIRVTSVNGEAFCSARILVEG